MSKLTAAYLWETLCECENSILSKRRTIVAGFKSLQESEYTALNHSDNKCCSMARSVIQLTKITEIILSPVTNVDTANVTMVI